MLTVAPERYTAELHGCKGNYMVYLKRLDRLSTEAQQEHEKTLIFKILYIFI